MIQKIERINTVRGTLKLPGDKSISHRSVMFSSMAGGESVIHNCLESADVISTINIFRQLGCRINKKNDFYIINGRGFKGFENPDGPLDAGNSGTTSRLISGILAAQDFESTLIGDDSLSQRPMKRVIDPLSSMGALFKTNEKMTLPMTIKPAKNLRAIEYELPVASAQVKSAVLLAGLHLDETTAVIEHKRTRNHTEKLLGLKVEEFGSSRKILVSKINYPEPGIYNVPSDISTAAFFIVLALVTKNSELILKDVSLNETRAGIIQVLKNMGGDIEINEIRELTNETYGDVVIRSSQLKNYEIEPEIIPNIIDEIPVLAVAGLFADGDFKIRNAKELRVKECDRINAVCRNMEKLKLDVTEFEDGFTISGSPQGTDILFESFDDHRIAMAFGIYSMLTEKETAVKDFECVKISNPDFLTQVKKITG